MKHARKQASRRAKRGNSLISFTPEEYAAERARALRLRLEAAARAAQERLRREQEAALRIKHGY